MKIAMVGTGNVATILGRLFLEAGHEIVSVSGRDSAKVRSLAALLKAKEVPLHDIGNTELLVVAVSDDAIERVLEGRVFNFPVVHTAGAVPASVLKNHSASFGVLYPLQSLRKEMQQVPEIPFMVEASNEELFLLLEALARSVSSNVRRCAGEERARVHLAAVVVSNFTNYLYRIAEEYCQKEGLEFSILQPLIEETASRLRQASPSNLQTGPAARNDTRTIEKHLQMLEGHEKMKRVYEFMTEQVRGK